MITSTKVIEVREGSVIGLNQDNKKVEIPADTVVVAAGLRSRTDLAELLVHSGIEFYEVGSCREPGQIAEAIADAFAVGCKM